MKKFQIVEIANDNNHAGSKATSDIATIAEKLGYEACYLKMNTTKLGIIPKIKRQIGYFFDWKKCYKSIEDESIVLLQHPFHTPQLTRRRVLYDLKKKKHVKIVSIVHDVEELRKYRFNDYYKREFEEMLYLADAIIVHNDSMLKYFKEIGVSEKKLVNLQIFDYLKEIENEKKVSFKKTITIAGNLDVEKCGYISELPKIKNVDINLYGPNFDDRLSESENIHYFGSFPANEIPKKLTEGFGVVWDGKSIEGCIGESGQYLKYNNPHKLSLYLSSCMPVVIWKEAAEADFVMKNNVGVCVDSLEQLGEVLGNMTEDEYNTMQKNAAMISEKLTSGFYAQNALSNAEKIIIGD